MSLLKTLLSLSTAALLAVAPLAATAGVTGMAHKDAITVTDAWVRVALPNRPTAGYMTLTNSGEAPDRLVAARSDAFETIELHESKMKDGVMQMHPIAAVEVRAGGMAMLVPGGKHLMLFGGQGLKEGDSVTVTLVFETAGEITLKMPVKKRGHTGHSGHGKHGKAKE